MSAEVDRNDNSAKVYHFVVVVVVVGLLLSYSLESSRRFKTMKINPQAEVAFQNSGCIEKIN